MDLARVTPNQSLLISSFNALYFQSVALKPLTDRVLVQIRPANTTPFNFYQYLTRPKLRDGHILYSNVLGRRGIELLAS